jgi:hypothetical protein
MDAHALMLAQLLTYAALIAATCEYLEIMKRRQLGRILVAQQAEIEQSALEGLVRVFLVDDDTAAPGGSRRRWRFRHRRIPKRRRRER